MNFEFSEAAANQLAKLGYDPQFGARPVKRVIQKKVLNALSKEILANKVNPEEIIYLDYSKDGFKFGPWTDSKNWVDDLIAN